MNIWIAGIIGGFIGAIIGAFGIALGALAKRRRLEEGFRKRLQKNDDTIRLKQTIIQRLEREINRLKRI